MIFGVSCLVCAADQSQFCTTFGYQVQKCLDFIMLIILMIYCIVSLIFVVPGDAKYTSIIALSFKRLLAPDPYGPFCISIFSKDIKDHKTQDTQTTILPISAIFLVFLVLKVFSCSVLLFCLLLCVTFY